MRLSVNAWSLAAAALIAAPTAAQQNGNGDANGGGGAAGSASFAAARASVTRLVDSLVQHPSHDNAQWGALIVADNGDTLYSLNARRLLVPASNQKIITGAVALATLGPSFRFATRFASNAPIRDGTLEGDLVVFGTGDPSFSDRMRDGDAFAPLRDVADSLRARGILRIDGALRRGVSPFVDSPIGFGWAWDDLGAAYAAPVGALMFNETFGAVRVEIEGFRDTVAAQRASQMHFLEALYTALNSRGISVRAAFDWNTTVPDTGLTTLVTVTSPPLAEILPYFQKDSQNQIGEILLKTMGLAVTGVGRADSGAAVVSRTLRDWGVDSTAFVVRDGSGLSRHNWVSPAALVRVLEAVRRDTAFATFRDALPLAGVDGTLERRMRGTDAVGQVRAKTGSMDRVRALSGYATTRDGRELTFSILVNGYTAPPRDIEAALDHVATYLASLTFER